MSRADLEREWGAKVVAAVAEELQGNARRDLIGWAHRTIDAGANGRAVPADVKRARMVLALNKELEQ